MCNLEIGTKQYDPKQELHFKLVEFLLNGREQLFGLKTLSLHWKQFGHSSMHLISHCPWTEKQIGKMAVNYHMIRTRQFRLEHNLVLVQPSDVWLQLTMGLLQHVQDYPLYPHFQYDPAQLTKIEKYIIQAIEKSASVINRRDLLSMTLVR